LINSRSRRAGNVARSEKSRSVGAVFVEKPEVKGTPETPRLESGMLYKNISERNRIGGRRR
jgi:hypothetical protein